MGTMLYTVQYIMIMIMAVSDLLLVFGSVLLTTGLSKEILCSALPVPAAGASVVPPGKLLLLPSTSFATGAVVFFPLPHPDVLSFESPPSSMHRQKKLPSVLTHTSSGLHSPVPISHSFISERSGEKINLPGRVRVFEASAFDGQDMAGQT